MGSRTEIIPFISKPNLGRAFLADLKPENLLLRSVDNDCEIKLADFGLAKKIPTDDSAPGLITMCGSPSYVAPEIVNGEYYNTQVDMWSCGAICTSRI